MIETDDMTCCDMRRAKRLARLMRVEWDRRFNSPPLSGQVFTFTFTLLPTATNVTYTPRPMTPARWRNLPRMLVREARRMGLPRYPRDVGPA